MRDQPESQTKTTTATELEGKTLQPFKQCVRHGNEIARQPFRRLFLDALLFTKKKQQDNTIEATCIAEQPNTHQMVQHKQSLFFPPPWVRATGGGNRRGTHVAQLAHAAQPAPGAGLDEDGRDCARHTHAHTNEIVVWRCLGLPGLVGLFLPLSSDPPMRAAVPGTVNSLCHASGQRNDCWTKKTKYKAKTQAHTHKCSCA